MGYVRETVSVIPLNIPPSGGMSNVNVFIIPLVASKLIVISRCKSLMGTAANKIGV